MTIDEIVKSLIFIRPKAQWLISEDDLDNLQWLDKNQTKPSWEEIEQGYVDYQNEQAKINEEAKIKRTALLNKLGLTEDEAKLLLS